MSWAVAATGAAVPVVVGVRWWRRHQRESAIMRELSETNADGLVVPSHLSPSLAAIAIETHRLRLELETPLRRIRAPLLGEAPWARRHRCDEYDAALCEVRRAIWEWIAALRDLGGEDRRLLGELGLSTRPFVRLLFGCDRTNDVWEQVVYARAPDLELVYAELRRTMLELKRFEHALTRGAVDPYRT